MATYYRIIKTATPTLWDFQSFQARGQRFRTPVDAETYRISFGLSAYDTLDRARANARRRPTLGTHIVPIEVPEGAARRVERTTSKRGHVTIFGEPSDVMALAGTPIPVYEAA